MLALSLRSVSTLGTVVTAAAFLFQSELAALVQVLLWVLILVAFVSTFADCVAHVRNRPHHFEPQSSEIGRYLCRWLQSGGKAAVFSRDLSWVANGSDEERILEDKARKKELVLFVGSDIPVAHKLMELGATVYTHCKGFTPQSRFTIIDHQKDGARVAIGVVERGRHVIREYDAGQPNTLALANDLVALGEKTGKRIS